MPKALAKFWPSSWLVPIWRALPSPMMASHAIVLTAPAKRSRAVFTPTNTGMASVSTMKARYTSSRIRRA